VSVSFAMQHLPHLSGLLVGDLDERGLLDSTLVIVMSEFGRTPRINQNLGRDHWSKAWSVALGIGITALTLISHSTYVSSPDAVFGPYRKSASQIAGNSSRCELNLSRNNGNEISVTERLGKRRVYHKESMFIFDLAQNQAKLSPFPLHISLFAFHSHTLVGNEG
jgi:hypothetical protein